MIENINETALAILNRIKRAVEDDAKAITPENLNIMSKIVLGFDQMMQIRSIPKYDLNEVMDKMLRVVKSENGTEVLPAPVQEGV